MDEEEFRKMLDRKQRFTRFSTARGAINKFERRSSIFNPSDPNNAQQAVRFMQKLPMRQRAMTKAVSSRSPVKEIEEARESMDNSAKGSKNEIDQPLEELFDEGNLAHILPVNTFQPLEEGQEVLQVISLLNDINEKQVNVRRRRNLVSQSPVKAVIDPEQVHLQEELHIKPGVAGLTPSIGQQ